ncbi:hypothetical protein sos41_03000 [Alphaproteobacteria bacterium SO-S41]|nr:hypothetical protein sos41_03000 [Alphaproteobacteria bacterium SO-S41]
MTPNDHLGDIATRFLSRRALLKGAVAAAALSATPFGALTANPARAQSASSLTFSELPAAPKNDPNHYIAPGYRADILISWGDPVLPGAPAFDPAHQTAATQAAQFGFNCDFIGYLPLGDGASAVPQHLASRNSAHGLLGVNHEATKAHMMFTGFADSDAARDGATAERVAVERASLGFSVIEVKRDNGAWGIVAGSPFARRISAETPIAITGPARGHARMKTAADPAGETVIGTFENCSGGTTPWGTYLTCEENIQNRFACKTADMDAAYAREVASAESFQVRTSNTWPKFDARFDMNATPHEFNRFGWVVEIDPYDPQSVPKKRTALGRFRHEAATIVAKDGKPVTAYLADDQTLEFFYKFVSARAYVGADPAANIDILDAGTLYVAQFKDDGTGAWLPLVHGEGLLTSENGFNDQGDVVIDARRAARLIGATETDRPEGAETDPITSRTYVAFTGGTDRKEPGPAMPRAPNQRGHIVEILSPGTDGDRDHAATTFTWDILLLAGNPHAEIASKGVYGPGTSEAGFFAYPDNIVFDPQGRLWIATDGGRQIGIADGLWACCVTGPERATTRHFYASPTGAEVTGPCFTPDGETLFVSIQHPGDQTDSSFDNPTTRWPAALDSTMPPRPSVIVVTREGGGPIGS